MIYLDHAATTPCDPAVLEQMLPFFSVRFGNASSIDHTMGSDAKRAVDEARAKVALFVGSREEDVFFTSGATEANNLAVGTIPRFTVTTAIEHPSVLEAIVQRRSSEDFEILSVSSTGALHTEPLTRSLREHPGSLVSIMHTNNEIGTRNDIALLAAITHEFGGLFHSDVTQGVVSATVAFRETGLDAVSISAHKIGGPKGVGALICGSAMRKEIRALALGGGHERGVRSGTLNVPGIVGLGAAAEIYQRKRDEHVTQLTQLRIIFLETLRARFVGATSVNALGGEVSPHILSIRLNGVNNRALLRLAGAKVSFALGSACATNKNEPSHVLRAIGLTDAACNETIRISFGIASAQAEITEAAAIVAEAANGLLQMVA